MRTRRRLRPRAIRTRLLLLVGAALVAVGAATALTTALFQRAYVMGELDDRVVDAAEHSLGGAALHPESGAYLGFLQGSGHPAGMLAARLDGDGDLLSAAVVIRDAPPRDLSGAQRAALTGLRADGSQHTRTVPGLGAYRVTVLHSDGVRVLTGLPLGDVQSMISELVLVETAVAAAGLAVAGCVCAMVVRRELRPLGRVAATAAEVSRTRFGHGDAHTRVPARDTDPDSEAGQIGAALNHLLDQVESSLAERQRGEERMRRSEERMRRFLADASHETADTARLDRRLRRADEPRHRPCLTGAGLAPGLGGVGTDDGPGGGPPPARPARRGPPPPVRGGGPGGPGRGGAAGGAGDGERPRLAARTERGHTGVGDR